MDGMTRTNTLSQCHVRHCYDCGERRENVTCEGVLFTNPWLNVSSIRGKGTCTAAGGGVFGTTARVVFGTAAGWEVFGTAAGERGCKT